MTNLFRASLVTSVIIFVFYYWMPSFGMYSGEFAELRQWDGWDAALPPLPTLNVALFVASVVVPILMYFFIPWSRAAFLLLAVCYCLLSLGWGVRISAPLENFLTQVVAMLNGAILAMAYFSPISDRFVKARAKSEGDPAS